MVTATTQRRSTATRSRPVFAHVMTGASIVLAFTALPLGVPRVVAVGGFALHLYEVTLLLAALAWLIRGNRSRSTDLTALVFLLLLGAASAISFLAGLGTSAIISDVRYLAMVPVAVFVAGRTWNAGAGGYVKLLTWVLWVSAVITMLASVTGLDLGQRQMGASLDIGDVSAASRLITEATYPAVAVIAVCLYLYLTGNLARGAGVALVVPSALIVLLSFSRNPLLSFAVAGLLAVLRAPSAALFARLVKLILAATAALLVVWGLAALDPGGAMSVWFDNQVTGMVNRVIEGISLDALSLDGSTQYRTQQENPYLWAAFQQSPILGHGFGYEYKPAFTGRYFATDEIAAGASRYAHMFYGWITVKTGLIGLTAFLIMAVFIPLSRALRRGATPIATALGAALLGMLVQSFVAPMPIGSPTSVLFGALLGLVLASTEPVVSSTQAAAGRAAA